MTVSLPEVTELKHELPVIRDMDGSYYCRQEKSGLLLGPYETADRMKIKEDWYDNGPPKGNVKIILCLMSRYVIFKQLISFPKAKLQLFELKT